MSESTIILAKESISDGSEDNKISEIRPLSNEEIEVYDTQKNIFMEFVNDFALVEYVRLNYESLMELLHETILKVAKEPSFIGSYPFKNFPFLLNTRILNYMMSVKTLLDHMETSINRRFGEDSTEFVYFKALTANEFDSKFSYRFMYKLRNFVQHCGMPPLSYTISKSLDETSSTLSIELIVYFMRDELIRGFSKWGPQVKADLTQMDESFSIMPIFNEHINAIFKVYILFNEKYHITKALKAKEYMINFIGESSDYIGDEYIIAKLKKTETGLSINKKTIPTSAFEKISDFYRIKGSLF
ncbi:hypothetical protein [Klebsiella quasipneumoniae]|uniref:hypothetical protein n=1 Tax=Klebsiella quasipneumoniae TaxID=1463165 RepID=UPI0008DF1156|nr:hypothetical protein [Klebsiella quasipneumoniae]SFH69768.1 hypothetical protein SAMN03159418_04960 [Klebsiella quasipneumoniae]SFX83201.1 hypothetical protein SAMN03159289_02286 [Klebsiella quasipneumoniae]SFY22594.1 hypothetical protein SAMN03159364_04838 [Klebsiella quasipneumoniae]SMC92796.1 hypothetical protein SAMN03159480_1021072 [Klebsiella quasipneumoniae]